MNKYLEKIAATRKAINKVELEPGVFYNLDKHELTPTPTHMNEFLAKKDRNNRLVTGGIFGVYGGLGGAALGLNYTAKRLENEQPLNILDKPKYQEAYDNWLKGGPDFQKHGPEAIGEWDRTKPKREHFIRSVPSEYKPKFTNLANKYGPKTFAKVIGLGAAGVGFLGAGSLGYLAGGLDPIQKKPLKDGYLEKLERKYEKEIDRIEGWDQYD